MSCPFFTGEFQSTNSFCTVPETCVPTWTVTSADSVPVAVTRATIRPRSTAAVSNSTGGFLCAARQRQTPKPAVNSTTSAARDVASKRRVFVIEERNPTGPKD